jgi:GT2 family glycosyltransferase
LSAVSNVKKHSETEEKDDVTVSSAQRILIVLVLYRPAEAGIPVTKSITQALNASELKNQFKILVYDNSPTRTIVPDGIPVSLYVLHDPENGGLFRAYSAALRLAERKGCKWMLTLDQDTLISADYLRTLCSTISQVARNRKCAAIVPKLLQGNEVISPAWVLWGGRLLPVKNDFHSFSMREITAFNSGSLLRISALQDIGGFNPKFWLDYLDHWLFNQLHRAGFIVKTMNITLQHDLSVQNMKNLQLARYNNILLAEDRFYRCCKSPAENVFYVFKLLARSFKMVVIPVRRSFFLPTVVHMLKRIIRALT